MASQFIVVVQLVAVFLSTYALGENNEFSIGPGDVIAIKVYNEPDLTLQANVDQSGILKIPLLGNIKVAGKTSTQLSNELQQAYLDGYLVAPSVSVVIVSYRPFFIKGAIDKAGAYKFEYDLTVDQAIAIAGGLKDRASKSEWYIVRGAEKTRKKVSNKSRVFPGDIIEIEESFF